jgi:hypothetical protein
MTPSTHPGCRDNHAAAGIAGVTAQRPVRPERRREYGLPCRAARGALSMHGPPQQAMGTLVA